MNNELFMGKSVQPIIKKEESLNARGTTPQNITVILPAFNEEVAIGSIVLLTKHYADHVIVVDDGSSDRTAAIARKAGAHVRDSLISSGIAKTYH
jgi:cellulose synthase/poly-beta-1,6-N-acetylglucosamine synthase-like glycosyltransferase